MIVDDEEFDGRDIRWTLPTGDYTFAALQESADARWPLGKAAVLTVPRDGGLEPRHPRRHARAPAANVVHSRGTAAIDLDRDAEVGDRQMSTHDLPFGLGVSLYSYTDDIGVTMTVEECIEDVADLDATGLEILGEGHIEDYPTPSTAWIDAWFARNERLGLTPTLYGSWLDTRRFPGRGMTVTEGADQLELDLRLAAQLGFSFVRPKIGVISEDLRVDPIWQEAVERNLQLAADLGIVICPEIHWPTVIKSPVVEEYLDFKAAHRFGEFRTAHRYRRVRTEPVSAHRGQRRVPHGGRERPATRGAVRAGVRPHRGHGRTRSTSRRSSTRSTTTWSITTFRGGRSSTS